MKNRVKEGLRGVIETVRDRGNYLAFKAKEFLLDERGMGTVEVILIIVVLIGLVIIFKKELDGLVHEIFKTINTDAAKVTG
nr:Flp1 family type IVb pilin [Butyrivibrio sp. WCD3002]